MPAPAKAPRLDAELATARSDARFVGWSIARYAIDRGRSRPRTLALLGLDERTAPALELRLRPKPDRIAATARQFAREHGCRAEALCAVLRHAAVLDAGEAAPAKLADELAVTARRVYQLRGVRMKKPRVSDRERGQIEAMLKSGMSRRSAAIAAGRTRKVIDAVAAGLRARPR